MKTSPKTVFGISVLILLMLNFSTGQESSICSPLYNPSLLADCGGTVTSPDYPNNVPGDSECYWLIQSTAVQYGVIYLKFTDFVVGNTDSLRIYDGDNTTASLIADLRGTYSVLPGSFLSTQEFMLLELTTSSGIQERHFNATYSSRSFDGACSPSSNPVNVTNGFGVITSPNFPDQYASTTNCGWLISPSIGTNTIVKLEIAYFNTERISDVLRIYDGSTTNDRLIAALSGSIVTPLLIQSTQRYMLVKFDTDFLNNSIGFSAAYSAASTGGECSAITRPRYLQTEGGIISSPNFPGSYYGEVDCQWVLTAGLPPFGVITFDFDLFDLVENRSYVYIYDGLEEKVNKSIAVLTGYYRVPPKGFTSTTEYMFVKFASTATTYFRGFTATYRTSSTRGACSMEYGPGRLTEERGQLTSPNYPFSYYSNAECRWQISAPGTYEVVTLFFDYFSTEAGRDILSIYDGPDANSRLIANLSGSHIDLLGPYMSTLQHLFLRFTSDGSNNYPGFSAEYTTTTIVGACAVPYQPYILSTDFSSFESPNYPGNYFGNADCQWLIIGSQPNRFVTIQFDFFETFNSSDMVYIYDGNTINARLLVNLSGSYDIPPGPFTTSQRQMLIQFKTDGLNHARGFSAMCRSLASDDGSPCASRFRPRVYTNDGGSLSSPQYPSNYTHNSDCQWLISSPSPNAFVVMNFDFFVTQLDHDFLYVYDGNTTNAPLLARLHGSNCIPPNSLISSQPYMLLRFTTDDSQSYRGFSANYASLYYGDTCTADLRPRQISGDFGTFTSPNFPGNYYGNADCQWLITSDRGQYGVVTLDFDYFSTETDADFVYVYDGGQETDPLIVKLHGSYSTLPQGYTTTQKLMLVRFTSDSSIHIGGFRANYKSLTSGGACSSPSSPLLLRYSGFITAPNNTVNYYDNATCSWLIQSADEQFGVVKLDFYYFNTQPDADFVDVYDGVDENARLLGRVSGTYCSPPAGYTTTQRYMLLKFNTDSKTAFNGFGATFQTAIYGGACSPQFYPRRLQGSGGTFTSPNFPFNYNDNADCQWLLQSFNGQCEVISLDFHYFFTEAAIDIVSMYDGRTADDALLIASLSGTYSTIPSGFRSTQQYMLVHFSSDGLTNYGGFSATYRSTFVPGGLLPTGPTEPTTPPIIIPDPCSPATQPFELTDYNGTFSSANYPAYYDNNADCQWRITSPDSTGIVLLEFEDFSTNPCCDIVFVHDGSSTTAPLLATLYGSYSELPVVNSTQRYLYVRFATGDQPTNRGFRASYTII